MISSPHKQRERERERARRESTPLRPAKLVPPPPLPHRPYHAPAKLFFFFSLLPQRFFSWSGRHRSTSPIWPSPTTSPRLRSTTPSSGPGLSLITDPPLPHHRSSTGESHPRTNLSLSLSHDWSCDFDFFVLIFVSCVVYIFWFFAIIFVWILRKCEKHDKNGFSRAFSAKQPNTRKYFPKYFLECNQTLENILYSKNIL